MSSWSGFSVYMVNELILYNLMRAMILVYAFGIISVLYKKRIH